MEEQPLFTKEETDLMNEFVSAYNQYIEYSQKSEDCEQRMGELNEQYNALIQRQQSQALPQVTRKLVLPRKDGVFLLTIDCDQDEDVFHYAMIVERLNALVQTDTQQSQSA